MNNKILKELLTKPNVVSVGRGRKKVGGVDTGKPCIVVGVKKKLPLSALKSKDIIPLRIGEEETDVVELGEIRLL
ncbi:MAG: hypothetical protein Q7T57_03840 [Dehalococcoidales bacterium]|nr:hypothetical protein [Dehalococcoidales bacterium]